MLESPVLFSIGSFGVPAMGVCILVGAILAVFLSWLLRKKSTLDWNDAVVDAIIWAVLLGFAGMKVLYWIVQPDIFRTAFQNGFFRGILSILMEGMVFYGGLIGGVLGIFIVSRKKKQNFFEFTDLMAPCFCVAHAFGRIGCLLAGCCYGIGILPDGTHETAQFGLCTYNGFCAVKYADGAMRLPVPLMEAIFLLLLCGVLVLIFRKEKHLGTTTGWYLILYAIWRFVIEMFRGDGKERGGFGGLYTSQWISILILLAGVAVLILAKRWKKGAPFVVFHEEDLKVPKPEKAEGPAKEIEETAEEAVEETAKEAEETVEEAADEAVAEEIGESLGESLGGDEE